MSAVTRVPAPVDLEIERIRAQFEALQRAYEAQRFPPLAERIGWLDAIERALRANVDRFVRAASEDFGHRSVHDTKTGDLWLSLSQLRYVRKNLPKWIKPVRRPPLLVFRPARAEVVYQPLGVVGIIAPWNYPVMLAISPLVGALAAGNRVMLKLSEHAPRTSRLLAEVLGQALPRDLLAVVEGGAAAGKAVSEQRFAHLLFTGGETVGRMVAQAAARNLVPVTLEMGGKNPAILHSSYSVRRFAERVVQGKCFNAGQSCIAPDYLLVPRALETEVVQALKVRVSACFPTLKNNPDYTAVASVERKRRLEALVDDAVGKGARAVSLNPVGESLDGTQKMPLTLLLGVPRDAAALEEELFGPVLPLILYDEIDDALTYINKRPRPLALYYFDGNAERVRHVLSRTVAGGVTINDTLLHYLCDALPRTAIGQSGQGAYLGRSSFELFSHNKSVVHQSRLSGVGLFAPPYTGLIDWVIERILRV
jgi:acyl-CoA reductase-like NAD-dependent aldehyde dehydrogenase